MPSGLSSHTLKCHVMEYVLGIVCFALYKKYGYDARHCGLNSDETWKCRFSQEIAIIAFDAFTLVITPILIIAHMKHGSKFEYSIVNPLFAFVGFVLYLVAGAVELNIMMNYVWYEPLTALASLSIVTASFYLADLSYWIKAKRAMDGD